MRKTIFTQRSIFYFCTISIFLGCIIARADARMEASMDDPYEPWGTVCSNEYVYERIDTLGGYLEVESRTYMVSDLRWLETKINNYLGTVYPVRMVFSLGYGASTNVTVNQSWETMYYPFYTLFENGSISNGYSETFKIAAKHNQQEIWKIFTNDFRSLAGVKLPNTILVTNIYITTLGPTQEPEPGMCVLFVFGGLGLARFLKRKIND